MKARAALAFFLACIAPAAIAWQPTGSLQELYDPALLPLLRPGVKAAMFSSYDRTGGNNDGFNGTYSKLREENGNSVLAEMEGPGAIQRIWFTHSTGEKPGLLELKGEHIRIYIDGSETPALDVPLESLFDNSLERFPNPIAGQGIGGFYSYVPIPYTKSCKVVVDGLGVRFYQINYSTFPSAEGVKPFQMEMSDEERIHLGKAVSGWSNARNLGDLHASMTAMTEQVRLDQEQPSGELARYRYSPAKIDSPALIREIAYAGNKQGEVVFDTKRGEPMRVPLDLFFPSEIVSHEFAPAGTLFASDGGRNRIPFYVPEGTLIGIEPVETQTDFLVVKYQQVDIVPADAGRLQVQVNESLPTVPDVHHPFLKTEGQGHYIGTYLVTSGPSGLPYWLEGDDKWTIDGELRIHGTGSEDYFNCGWYALEGRLNGPACLPSHGFPVYGIRDDRMHANAYRWHISDPVPFDKSINVEIEHGEANKHVADYRSISFYYVK